MEKIILASSSPRRRELLGQVGCDFEIIVPDVEEPRPDGMTPEELVLATARVKCAAVADTHPDRVVLAADTLVALGGAVLGKPHSEREAVEMLEMLSGREHTVYTGVVVRCGAAEQCGTVATAVRFRRLSPDEIARYVATGEPMDKAGAYGIQSRGALFVESISGDWSNVVGLPLVKSAELLGRFGIELI